MLKPNEDEKSRTDEAAAGDTDNARNQLPILEWMMLREKLPAELLAEFERVVNEASEDDFLEVNQSRNKLIGFLIKQNYQNEIQLASQRVLVEEIKDAAGARKIQLSRPHKIAALASLILVCAMLVITGILTQFLINRQRSEQSQKNMQKITDLLMRLTPIESPPPK
jgi:hypothetical protein